MQSLVFLQTMLFQAILSNYLVNTYDKTFIFFLTYGGMRLIIYAWQPREKRLQDNGEEEIS
jgi:low temperature requirement protein LtrA